MANEPDPARPESAGQSSLSAAHGAPSGTVPAGVTPSGSPAPESPKKEDEFAKEHGENAATPPAKSADAENLKEPEAASTDQGGQTDQTDQNDPYNSPDYYGEYGGEYESPGASSSESTAATTAATTPATQTSGGEPPASNTDSSSDSGDDDDEGGPVKPFLEHLEDLRWVLVKCSAAIFVGLLVCLLGVNYVVDILKWPLKRAGKVHTGLVTVSKAKHVGLAMDGKIIWKFRTESTNVAGFDLGTNAEVVLQMTNVLVNGKPVVSFFLETNSPLESELGIGPGLINLSPADAFITSLHIAFFAGLILASPFVFYFLGQFIVPALRWKEKKYFLRAFIVGLALFLIGVCFCYFLLMPVALQAAVQYSLWMGIGVMDWQASTYFSFVCKFMLGMGLGFEMPVVLLALVKIGILDYAKLAGFRRYMIVVNLILGAILTTPEVVTQLLMFVPLQLLYEVTIWIAWYWEKKEKAKQAAEGNEQS